MKKNNIPALRFPQFNEPWTVKKLGEVGEFISTNSLSRDKLNYENGSVYNIHYGDIHTKFKMNFILNKENVPFINEGEFIAKSDNCYCKNGDLIIADASEDYNDIGKAIEVIDNGDCRIVAGLHTLHYRPKDIFALGYLGTLFASASIRRKIQKIAQGISVLGISKTNIESLPISLPTLPEQQKIADFLSGVDEKIGQLERRLALEEQYKKGMMQRLFDQKIRFKDDNGNEFPDWEEKKLGEVCEFYNGRAYKQSELLQEGKYRVLRVGNFFTNDSWYYSDLELDDNKYANKGDLLYAWSASFGPRFWYDEKVIYHYHIWKIDKLKNITPQYLYDFLYYDKEKIGSQMQGGTMSHITKGEIENRPISLPTLPEQQKIADFLSSLDDKIGQTKAELEKARVWKRGLMQRMFV